MIDIQIMPEQFAYDVQSLVKAFYSEHDFKVNQVVDNSLKYVPSFLSQQVLSIEVLNNLLLILFRYKLVEVLLWLL